MTTTPTDGITRIRNAFRAGVRPPAVLDLDVWAERFMVAGFLKGGRLDLSMTPYAREVMRWLSLSDPTQDVTILAGTQTFKTTVGLAWLAYLVYYGAGPFMHVRPTKDDLRKWVSERLDPLWQMACLADKVSTPGSRSRKNTTTFKQFLGGFFYGCGTKRANEVAAHTVRFTWQDETDREEPSCGKEGPAHGLVLKRTDMYGAQAKHLNTTSPTMESAPGWQMYQRGTMGEFYVPCPHCGTMQVLRWEGIVYKGDPLGADDAFDVWYECSAPKCRARIDEHHKGAMLAAGEWRFQHPERRHRSVRLPSLYSPPGWLTWKAMAREWQVAVDAYRAGDPGPMQIFRNTSLCEPWEPRGEDEVPTASLLGRREAWPEDALPLGVLLLTAGVDTQDYRLEWHVKGWGARGERWTIDYRIVEGGPLPDPDTGLYDWDVLREFIRQQVYTRADGRQMRVELTCVDLQGHRVDEAYKFTRSQSPQRVVGIIGKDGQRRPVVERQARTSEKRAGARYRLVGVDPGKANLFASLHTPRAKLPDGTLAGGPNVWHFPQRSWCNEEFFQQLTAEHSVKTRNSRGQEVTVWVQHRSRNEVLDTANYAYIAYRVLEIEGRLRAAIERNSPRPAAAKPQSDLPAEASPSRVLPVPVDNLSEDESASAPTERGPGPVRGRWHGRSDPRRD